MPHCVGTFKFYYGTVPTFFSKRYFQPRNQIFAKTSMTHSRPEDRHLIKPYATTGLSDRHRGNLWMTTIAVRRISVTDGNERFRSNQNKFRNDSRFFDMLARGVPTAGSTVKLNWSVWIDPGVPGGASSATSSQKFRSPLSPPPLTRWTAAEQPPSGRLLQTAPVALYGAACV